MIKKIYKYWVIDKHDAKTLRHFNRKEDVITYFFQKKASVISDHVIVKDEAGVIDTSVFDDVDHKSHFKSISMLRGLL